MNTREYIQHLKDSEYVRDEEVKEFNKALVEKYPWLVPCDELTGELDPNYDYQSTWMDEIPDGWRVAFGDQMVEELDQLLKKYNVTDYKISQIKEKFGELRWYDDDFPEKGYEEYDEWLTKYEDLSKITCIRCGEPAKYLTTGCILPVCESCVPSSFTLGEGLKPIKTSYR